MHSTSLPRKAVAAVALLAIAGLSGAAAQAETVSLRNGAINAVTGQIYTGQSNNLLAMNGYLAGNNYGRLQSVIGGGSYRKSTIMQFDLSSLNGVVGSVQSATLTLMPTNPSGLTQDFSFSVYLIVPENAGWDAGYSNASLTTTPPRLTAPGESAWGFKARGTGNGTTVSQILNDPTNVKWHSGGNFGEGDYVAQAIAVGTYKAGSLDAITLTIPPEVIAGWINNPSANAGIYIASDIASGLSDAGFYSGNLGAVENALALRPELTINYQIPEPSAWAALIGGVSLAGVVIARRRRR